MNKNTDQTAGQDTTAAAFEFECGKKSGGRAGGRAGRGSAEIGAVIAHSESQRPSMSYRDGLGVQGPGWDIA